MATEIRKRRAGSPSSGSTVREDMITALLSSWLMLGLFVDGWAHVNLSELETFFTPWHGIFYSGFMATAGWVAWMVGSRRLPGESYLSAIPSGYGLGVVGLIVFTVGGVGDGIWHTVYGIEESLDALLSPTHLLLFLGIVLIITSPLRAAWARSGSRHLERNAFTPVMLSTLLVSTVSAFFFMYAWAPNSYILGAPFVPIDQELFAAFGVLEFLATTIVLFGPSVLLVSRFDTPRWTFTALMGTVGVLMAGIEAFNDLGAIVPPLAAGLTIDLVAARFGIGPANRVATRLAFGAAGLVLTGVRIVIFDVVDGVVWPPEIWGGALLFSGLVGAGLTVLAVPPAIPEPAVPLRHEVG